MIRPQADEATNPIEAEESSMIARTWRGWASPQTAEGYRQHYEAEVAEHLRQVPGFLGARLLRRMDGDEVRFTSITYFTDRDAVRSFAGADYEQAVVEDAARQTLSRWDERVSHHDVAADL
jgi:heme-degrading monooxygenase HmoA